MCTCITLTISIAYYLFIYEEQGTSDRRLCLRRAPSRNRFPSSSCQDSMSSMHNKLDENGSCQFHSASNWTDDIKYYLNTNTYLPFPNLCRYSMIFTCHHRRLDVISKHARTAQWNTTATLLMLHLEKLLQNLHGSCSEDDDTSAGKSI